ncbi:MAG: tetraacyldisaccharide 4'-kinase [Aureispira sp.]
MSVSFFRKKYFLLFVGRPLGWLYGIGAWLHRAAYVYGPFKRHRFAPFVISVGNLSVGGTGKSPHVLYLQHLLGATERTAMVSRGYGRKTKGVQWVQTDSQAQTVGDEPLQFKLAHPKALVVVAEQRAKGIQAALQKQPQLEQVLLDDAMQHWGIQADCTFMLTTFAAPFFRQHVLPFGQLREFRSGYKRAEVIIVTQSPSGLGGSIRNSYLVEIKPLPHQKVLFSWLSYKPLYDLWTGAVGPSLKTGQEMLLLTGIADTTALKKYLSKHTITEYAFPDHHLFTLKDLQKVQENARNKLIITTEKDATRLRPVLQQNPSIPLQIYVLPVEVVFSPDDAAWLKEYLQAQKAKKMA